MAVIVSLNLGIIVAVIVVLVALMIEVALMGTASKF